MTKLYTIYDEKNKKLIPGAWNAQDIDKALQVMNKNNPNRNYIKRLRE